MSIQKTFWRGGGQRKKVLKLMSKPGTVFVIFDTETTGLNEEPNKDRIIQLSALKCVVGENGEFSVTEEFDRYLNPGRILPGEITRITGITDAMLKDKPTEGEAFLEIDNFFRDAEAVCCHNAPFDTMMLSELYGRQRGMGCFFDSIDTLKMAQELHSRREVTSFKLSDLAAYFCVDEGLTFHNSMDDVYATTRLLKVFIKEYMDTPEEEKVKMRVVSTWPYSSGYSEVIGQKRYSLRRLYARLEDGSVVFLNQGFRPFEWTEKTPGTIGRVDMYDVERQVMQRYRCQSLQELARVKA